MKKVFLFVLMLMVCGVLENSVQAQMKDRYRVTYIRSRVPAAATARVATVVTVVNQSSARCEVQVEFLGSAGNSLCQLTENIGSGFAFQFCTRNMPNEIINCNPTTNNVCAPQLLSSGEGTAIVSSTSSQDCSLIAVDARVYYTSASDTELRAVSNPKIVFIDEGNLGD